MLVANELVWLSFGFLRQNVDSHYGGDEPTSGVFGGSSQLGSGWEPTFISHEQAILEGEEPDP